MWKLNYSDSYIWDLLPCLICGFIWSNSTRSAFWLRCRLTVGVSQVQSRPQQMALYYSPSNCLANGLFLAASLSMKQSGQKSKLCVTLIACFITSSGKIFCIFSRPSTYILDVAITDVAISEVVLCSTSLDAWLHACLRLSSGDAENIMTGYGHRELFKVTCYNFQPSRAC